MTTSTSIKAEAKLNFASSCPVAWTDYSFFLSIDTGSLTLWYSCQIQAKQNARKSWQISLANS